MSVRFALIGCGKITERLALPQLAGCADAEVVALVDTRRPVAERMAAAFGIAPQRIWTDWRQMLREAEVDAVGVCLPNDLHAEVAIASLEAKKHVMVEKPIATTLAEADAIIAAAKANQRVLMVEQTQRFDPIHEVARDVLQEGTLGRVTQLRGRIGHDGPEYWSEDSPWFTDGARAGGGALMDVGIHIADLLLWLSGKSVARVCAQAKTLEKRVAVEDNASALLEFSDGTLGSFEVSWTTHPYEVTTHWYAQRGTLQTRLGAVPPVVYTVAPDPRVPPEEVRPAVPAHSRYQGAYPAFVRSLLDRTPPPVSGEEGRAALEVVLAAYESARRGGWVTLPLAGSPR